MQDRDFLDITEKTPKDNPVDFSEGDFFNPGRTRVNDFKRTANSVRGGSSASESPRDNSFRVTPPLPSGGGETVASVNFSDEKIVWVGAIFVFFGVLVFLVGFWLGKNTLHDLTTSRTSYSQRMEEKLQQKKVENQLVAGVTAVSPESLGTTAVTVTPVVTPVVAPILPEKHEEPAAETVRTLPLKKATSVEPRVKLDTKKDVAAVKKPVVVTPVKTVAPTIEAKKGDYTLQISAHTSMDKARFIEDQMRSIGLSAYIVEATVNGTTYYRVRVGRFGAKSEADSALAKVKASPYGKDSFLLNLN